MLIQALAEYYDILENEGKITSDEYSSINIDYIVCLTECGTIDHIIECEKNTVEIMPKRSEKPGICSNIIEHRALYVFGLNFDKGVFSTEDRTDKARKSHKDFMEKNLNFIEGLDSPIVNAYRNFIITWVPENETENEYITQLGKKYASANFAFCLRGNIEALLHNEHCVKERWEEFYQKSKADEKNCVMAQCAVTGKNEKIERVHDKIRGLSGGLSTGAILIGFNNDSENSYGNEQSYNSNVSEKAMRKYTRALNYILHSRKNRALFDDVTVVHWTVSHKEADDDVMSMLMFQDFDSMDESRANEMLSNMLKDAREGRMTAKRVSDITGIDENVDFYMVGLKPNSSRISVKFIYKKKAADILIQIARHQLDLQVSEKMKPVPFWAIKKELLSPKSTNDKVNPAVLAKIFQSAIYGTDYPQSLLSEIIRRVKTDKTKSAPHAPNRPV